jgi:hypothetical protein
MYQYLALTPFPSSYTHCYTYAHSISYSRAQSDSHAYP